MRKHSFAEWLLLMSLVVMFGSAFMMTKIAVATIEPSQLVLLRLMVGAVVLYLIAMFNKQSLRGLGRLWIYIVVLAVIGNCMPFYLISWGQQRIDSGLVGILMAIMPLSTLVMAHFLVKGETMTRTKLAGFVLGFIGIVVLIGPDALLQFQGSGKALLSELAVLGGALCYALNAIITKRLPANNSLCVATGVLISASLFMLPMPMLVGETDISGFSAASMIAALMLGIFSTGIAMFVYFKLLSTATAAFFSLINYLIPLWALFIGVVFMGEQLEWRAIMALLLILGGVGLAQLRPQSALQNPPHG